LARTGVSRQQIFTAAKEIAAAGRLPTAVNVRQVLATGSIVTIQKYLKEWKKSCFNQVNLRVDSNVNHHTNNEELIEQQRNLEQAINKQIAKNEHYAQELINAEKTNIALKETICQLQATNQQLQLELQETKAIKMTLAQVNLEIQTRLDTNNNDLINKQQLLINELRAELKELNVKSMLALQQTSSSSHELLMQEKLASMNLQEKINTMSKQLSELQQQLQTVNNKLAAKQQPLLRQIEWQQKIIQNHLGFEKLRQIEEEELRLKFNAQVQVAYGK
jgi:hypothetical protein